ncbi:hypothetical protein DL96DRAFT_1629602, partial [Flagelloscypha sp. PMI_526]
MAKPLWHNYKDLVCWSPRGPFITSVSREVAIHLQSSYLPTQKHRPLMLDEAWLRKSYEECTRTLQSVQSHSFRLGRPPVDVPLRMEDLKLVRGVLDSILRLPLEPFPPFPTDIVFEIMRWTVFCHKTPLNLSLVSSPIQRFLDPMLFYSCIIGDKSRYLDCLSRNPKQNISRSWSSESSPRLFRCRTHVGHITLKTRAPSYVLDNLTLFFPNVRRLVLSSENTSFIIPTHMPTLKFLECNGMQFGALNFADPLFLNLTTLSLSITINPIWTNWKWNSLLQLKKLSFLWISAILRDRPRQQELLEKLKMKILPSLPSQAQFCALRPLPYRRLWGGQIVNEDFWDTENLRSFADGSWSSQAVLVLAKKPDVVIPQAVILGTQAKNTWDIDRD